MNKYIFTIILLSIVIPSTLYGQNKFWKKVQIKKAFESLDDKKDPAVASMTFPRDTVSSYLVNGGISFRLITVKHKKANSEKMVFEPFFVLNRNTLIDKKQHNYKLGISQSWKLGHLDLEKRKLTYFNLDNSLQYLRDKIDSSHSIVVTSYISMINNSAKKGSIYVNEYKPIGKGFFYYLTWSAGLEYQNKFQAKKIIEEGSILRGYYNAGFKICKKIDTLKVDPNLGNKLIELAFSHTGRYDFINSTGLQEGYLQLFKVELLLYPTLNSNFSIGISYNNGSDPLKGLLKQNFYQIALNFKR